jgi:hypothetical protein
MASLSTPPCHDMQDKVGVLRRNTSLRRLNVTHRQSIERARFSWIHRIVKPVPSKLVGKTQYAFFDAASYRR